MQILGFIIDWYWLIVIPTAIICVSYFVYSIRTKQKNLSWFMAILCGVSIASSGFIGSKLLSYLELSLILDDLPHFSALGFRLYGAILGGVVSCIAMGFLFNTNTLRGLLDTMALVACIGFAIGKVGCFLSGHPGCYGIETNLPWGVEYVYQGKSIGYLAHPTQLYDFLFYGSLYLYFIAMRRKDGENEGMVFCQFLFASSLYSFLVEFIRDNSSVFGFLTFAQIVYGILFLISWYLLTSWRFAEGGKLRCV